MYVKSSSFSPSKNHYIAREIETLNKEFGCRNEGYVLVGPGRWGSEDYFLGIPVKWQFISNARVIVETALAGYQIEPSQGTHFFQNLTSFRVGYFTVNEQQQDGVFNESLLDSMDAEYESEHVRIVKFENPLDIKINGLKGKGAVIAE